MTLVLAGLGDQANALVIAGAIGSAWALIWGLITLVQFFIRIAGR